ncbi:MAG: DUF2520 domain-containing protein [Tannerellaceae bacterium]|jgi:predicted short-subunit dehydrogenase-like oxidoreductase (DUF2520 family)|nr:DUF2520 domain-containing protein [Tannerellaceae bacterium]
MKIVFIGAGNLATCISLGMQRAGMGIGQIYSRTRESAEPLAKRLNCRWTTNLGEIVPNADLYIFAVKDSALAEVVSSVKPNDGLWVHTSGSMPMHLFEGYARRYGVFYPLQTFTKERKIQPDGIPVFLEAASEEDMKLLKEIAIALSGRALPLDSEKRKRLHMAAVFACNFTNHMYCLAGKILAEQDIPYDILLPLITETAAKVGDVSPQEAQTGPAVRFDKEVLDAHTAMLADPAMRAIYQLISQNIYREKLSHELYPLRPDED